MGKHKEADVLKIKQDIAVLSRARDELIAEIEDLKDRRKTTQASISVWRDVYVRMGDAIVEKVQKGTQELKALTDKRDGLQEELSEGQHLLWALNLSIADAKKQAPEDNTSFLRGVLMSLQKSIMELAGKKQHMEASVAQLAERQKSLDLSLRKLNQDKLRVLEQIQALMKAIATGATKYSEVMAEIEKHEATLEAIDKRERDSRILMHRLSAEYREAYFKRHGSLDT